MRFHFRLCSYDGSRCLLTVDMTTTTACALSGMHALIGETKALCPVTRLYPCTNKGQSKKEAVLCCTDEIIGGDTEYTSTIAVHSGASICTGTWPFYNDIHYHQKLVSAQVVTLTTFGSEISDVHHKNVSPPSSDNAKW